MRARDVAFGLAAGVLAGAACLILAFCAGPDRMIESDPDCLARCQIKFGRCAVPNADNCSVEMTRCQASCFPRN